jgi:hypothetical protein
MAEGDESPPVGSPRHVAFATIQAATVNDVRARRGCPDRRRPIKGVAALAWGAAESGVIGNATGNEGVDLLIVGGVQTAIQGKQGQAQEANTAHCLKCLR